MIHDIYPKKYFVQYKDYKPMQSDTILLFHGECVCCRLKDEEASFPVIGDFADPDLTELHYIFSIDEERFFMPDTQISDELILPDGYEWHDYSIFRTAGPRHLAFAVVTAQALNQWYQSSTYCGRCGAKMLHSKTERARVCPKCELIVYPKISPVIIAAVMNGETLLVTRYKNRPFRNYALVAGFCESGESLEDTVRREVFEETGVRVKNIQYYKSQPWGFTSTLLSGFFCELDGDSAITVDENELSEAIWIPRNEIPPAALSIALTAEMIELFRTGFHFPVCMTVK